MVKLKAVCQRCGKVDVVDTDNPVGWTCNMLDRFVSRNYWEAQYQLWLCADCEQKVRSDPNEYVKMCEAIR